MVDTKLDKNAMSRALGAAFLNHQVQQLEKSVDDQQWNRDRRGPRGGGGGRQRATRTTSRSELSRARRSTEKEVSTEHEAKHAGKEKDADIVIVDASVLVHALGKLQGWCKNGRDEIVIVPLEALNTLDLLKKGTSPLAQRARAASRILEQQVGSNARIKVQRDEAYVLWDKINFAKDESHQSSDSNVDNKSTFSAPEWLRRTISCARWELDQCQDSAGAAAESLSDDNEGANKSRNDKTTSKAKTVVLAVCLETAQTHETPTKSLSPVPLPVPPTSKHEQRCSGALVTHWAKEAGIPVLECKATPLPAPPGGRHGHTRVPSDEEWRSNSPVNANIIGSTSPRSPKPKFGSIRGSKGGTNGSNNTILEKPNVYGPGLNGGGGIMVERPAATMAMNASMMQSRFNKPIRVLARGEKLEP